MTLAMEAIMVPKPPMLTPKRSGADAVVYQDLEDLKDAVVQLNPAVKHYDCSCFDGQYITGDVDEAYLQHVESIRKKETAQEGSNNSGE